MAGNSFGNFFRLSTYGESHGDSIGGIIDGCPAGLVIDLDLIQNQLYRRKPGQSSITTERKESDKVYFHSGIFEGKTLGTPIGFSIQNSNQNSKDYSNLKDVYRPSHADYTWQEKYGVRDYRGGGRASARETACRVVAGAIAEQFLAKSNIEIVAWVSQIGNIHSLPAFSLEREIVDQNIVRCPDEEAAQKMLDLIQNLKNSGDSIGGLISCEIRNVPVGLGEPVFEKLSAKLAYAMMGINAVKGFEIGSGFSSASMNGSEHNDEFKTSDSGITTASNFSGGIQGGISNGENITFNVAFKPVASIKTEQKTVDKSGKETSLQIDGRHDPCVVPRAVPIVESMAALVIADMMLLKRTNKL